MRAVIGNLRFDKIGEAIVPPSGLVLQDKNNLCDASKEASQPQEIRF
jgi:hypothetical protein